MTSEALMGTLKRLCFKIPHVPPSQNMCHTLVDENHSLPLAGSFPSPCTSWASHRLARGFLIASATFYTCAEEEKGNKKAEAIWTSHDRGLQRYCLSPCHPTDQTQIKWSKINSILIMQVLQFVTGIASGKQASWLHVNRHTSWMAETFLVWQQFVVLCDHPPKVNK